MRIRYTIPFTAKIAFSDHWPFPVAGGLCSVVEKDGVARALEVVFENQPVELAPLFLPAGPGPAKFEIRGQDPQIALVRATLEQAMGFLQCYHGVGLVTDEIASAYEPETPEEKARIQVLSMEMGKQEHIHRFSFSMLTRAVMAAEAGPAPVFEVALVSSARDALIKGRFIDSFRYSFLLIEFLHGDGQFRGAGLKEVLRKDNAFNDLLGRVLAGRIRPHDVPASDTLALLDTNPTTGDVIDHLVDKRGFYFHGNIKRKDTWKPDQQEGAKLLAFLAIDIASTLAQEAAAPMFDEKFNQRHVDDAKKAGAKIVMQVRFDFSLAEDGVARQGQFNFACPATKLTPALAQGVAGEFFQAFERDFPTGALKSATCVVEETGEVAFEMTFHAKSVTPPPASV